MNLKYEKTQFPELQDINNFEYYKVCFKLTVIKAIKLSKKVIPKLIKIYRSKIGK